MVEGENCVLTVAYPHPHQPSVTYTDHMIIFLEIEPCNWHYIHAKGQGFLFPEAGGCNCGLCLLLIGRRFGLCGQIF